MTVRFTVAIVGAIAVLGTPAASAAPDARLTDFHEVPMIVPEVPALPQIGPSTGPTDPSPDTLDLRLPGMRQMLNAEGGAPASPGPVAPPGPSEPPPLPIRIGYTVEWITG